MSSEPKKKSRLGLFAVIGIVVLCGAIFALMPRGGDDDSETAVSVQCLRATAQQREFVLAGVEGAQASNEVRATWAIEIDGGGYLVASMIYGPGIEDGTGPGVWYIDGSSTDPGRISSINGTAKAYTDFPDASLTMSTNGAREVERCAEP